MVLVLRICFALVICWFLRRWFQRGVEVSYRTYARVVLLPNAASYVIVTCLTILIKTVVSQGNYDQTYWLRAAAIYAGTQAICLGLDHLRYDQIRKPHV